MVGMLKHIPKRRVDAGVVVIVRRVVSQVHVRKSGQMVRRTQLGHAVGLWRGKGALEYDGNWAV